MNKRSTSFEVQVLKDKRWVTTDIMQDADTAVQFADNLVAKNNIEAVRVIRDFARLDGLHSENVIHEKAGGPVTKSLSISAVTETPMCTEIEHGYGLSSRIVIARLFRQYLDEMMLTPTELLHSSKEMKRLADKDRLLMSAVDSIAGLQAPAGGEDAKRRRDFLHKAWDQIAARAAQVPVLSLPKNATMQSIKTAAGGKEDHLYRCKVLISSQLIEIRAWLGKLDKVMSLAAEDEAAPEMCLIDSIVADIMQPAQAIQDLLGFQPNLAGALLQICDLADGKAEAAKFAHEGFANLNRLFAEGKLGEAREALLFRVTRELRGSNPLSKNQPDQEFEMFLKLMEKLVGPTALFGGTNMAEALVQRSLRFQQQGGGSGYARAIDDIMTNLQDNCRKTIFLMALAALPVALTGTGPTALQMLARIAQAPNDMNAWVPKRIAARDKMLALTGCNKVIREATAIPEELQKALATRTDETLAQYLEAEQIIEKIDKPDDPLAFRALRLVKFIGSGVLIPGKSMDMAKGRIVNHLRQAQFEEKFLSSVPDQTQAEKYLRDFHKLLLESGFRS